MSNQRLSPQDAPLPAVLVTRAAEQAEATCALLRSLGFAPNSVPAIALREVDAAELAAQLAGLAQCDWLLLTSSNAVTRLARFLPLPKSLQIAAVGPMTARAIEQQLGRKVDLIAPSYRAEQLADALLAALGAQPRKLMLVRAEQARDVLPERLRAAGHTLDIVVCYAVEFALENADLLQKWLQNQKLRAQSMAQQNGQQAHRRAWVLLASSRSVDAFVAQAARAGFDSAALRDLVSFAAISPLTAERLSAHGLQTALVPPRYTIDAMCHALAALHKTHAS